MVGPLKTHPAHSTGLESKKNSSDGEGFSLDRSSYRTDISTRNFRIAGDTRTSIGSHCHGAVAGWSDGDYATDLE